MELRRLGNTDFEITPVGFGAWAIGGSYQFGWGQQDDQDSINTIHAALDAGINWIDTAAIYGLGHSEEIVARALKGVSQKPYVFTKLSRVWDATGENISDDQSVAGVRRQVEESLRRLQVETIDLMQFHWPRPDDQLESGWETLLQLKQEGKIRHIAVCNYNVAQMERIAKIAPISSLQPPYSIIRPDVEDEILPYCGAHNIGVIVYSPMQSGLLTGAMSHERMHNLDADDWRKRNPMFQEPRLTRNLAIADLLKEIGAPHGRTAGEVAIAWTLRRPEVTAAIVGARHPQQIDGIIGAMDFRLGDAEIGQISDFVKANP